MQKTIVPFTLRDDYTASVRGTVEGMVAISEYGIEIFFDGYGVAGGAGAAPIFVEFWNRRLQLFAWDDINDDGDPVRVDLEGARLDKFVEQED